MAIAEAPVADQAEGQTAETPAEGQTPAKKERSKRSLNGIYVNTPKALRDLLEARAQEQKTSVAALVRDELAKAYGITLPAAAPRTKYSSPEEKVAARKAANKSRQELMKQLMKQYREDQARLAQAQPNA